MFTLCPKKPSEFIEVTADILKCDKQLVQDLSSFFWIEARKSLVELRGHYIFIEGFGTFKVKSWRLKEYERKYRVMIDSYEKRQITFQRFTILKELNTRLEKITNLQSIMEKDKVKKQQIKQSRNEKGL